jgi:putative spermidine/putrescine transport system substrate-binding protein
MPFVRRASASPRSLKVGSPDGTLGQALTDTIYPGFEEATGIAVEPADAASADILAASQEELIRGAGLWRAFDAARIPNLAFLDPQFVHEGPGGIQAVGAVAWYQTLVVNPRAVEPRPASWKALWEPGRHNAWGLAAGRNSTLFEITAATWFGGNAILDTEEGIARVVAKIGELKPNVRLWWDSEGAMQTAYEDGQILGGMYFDDFASRMAHDGTEIASIFPEEGAVVDFASWSQPAASTKVEEAAQFVNFMSAPETQAALARTVGTAPLLRRDLTGPSDAEFKARSGDRPPIRIAVQARLRSLGMMQREFAKMLIS